MLVLPLAKDHFLLLAIQLAEHGVFSFLQLAQAADQVGVTMADQHPLAVSQQAIVKGRDVG